MEYGVAAYTKEEKRLQKKRLTRNLMLIGVGLLLFATTLCWLFCGAYLEIINLKKNGVEVKAYYDRISEVSSFHASGGDTMPTNHIYGYDLHYIYVDKNGRKYEGFGEYFSNKSVAESHIGKEITIFIDNISGKSMWTEEPSPDGKLSFIFALVFSVIVIIYGITITILHKKIFLTKEEKEFKKRTQLN